MSADLLILLLALTFTPLPEAQYLRYAADVCAEYYGLDPATVRCVVMRESSWQPDAVGDDGLAVGLCQWHLESWKHVRQAMGLPETDRRLDPVESLMTMCWGLSQEDTYSGWWVTHSQCVEETQ